MIKKVIELYVIKASRVDEGLLIYFSNGTTVIYHTQFLYDIRDHDGNKPIAEEGTPTT